MIRPEFAVWLIDEEQHQRQLVVGERLRQLPRARTEQPDRDLLAERFESFKAAS